MSLLRQTKIIATLGPATDAPEVIRQMIEVGVNLVRLNMSHGDHLSQEKRIQTVRALAKELQKPVGILVDLQGPKIRVANFKEGSVTLVPGQSFILDSACDPNEGNQERVGLDYAGLVHDVKPGDCLLLNDGLIEMKVMQVSGTQIQCQVTVGGVLSNHKGINLKGGGLSAGAITDKDKADIEALAHWNVDYVALSFVRSADDIEQARHLLNAVGSTARLIAKIERVEAVEHMNSIIDAADAIMVARGDLGVELGYAQLPGVQKALIHRALARDKAVITATQMMESMIKNPIPTRAEVSDVANAVLDGTDAVMLSAETATGDYPVAVVQAMHDICIEAEKRRVSKIIRHHSDVPFARIDETIAMAAMYAAHHIQIAAIIALTESGATPLWMSRVRSPDPIFGLSRNLKTLGYMTLYGGVYPLFFDVMGGQPWEVSQRAIDLLTAKGWVKQGERVLITKGEALGQMGGANALKILMV